MRIWWPAGHMYLQAQHTLTTNASVKQYPGPIIIRDIFLWVLDSIIYKIQIYEPRQMSGCH